MLLEDKTAVIYGASGSIGSAVARTFAREGATVHLVGRTRETLDEIGVGHVAVLDALDQAAVDAHADSLGRIDISFNLIFRGDRQGTPLVDMTAEDLLRPVTNGLLSSFYTARAAVRNGAGVILHLTSASSRGAMPGMGGTGPADAAQETFFRYLAAEVGPTRVVGIHTAAVAETLTSEKLARTLGIPEGPPVEAILQGIAQQSVLKRPPALQEIAETAAFLASDRAGSITGTIVNATAGLVLG